MQAFAQMSQMHNTVQPPAMECRSLLQAGHQDMHHAVLSPQLTGQGRIAYHMMRISTHLYASRMPAWHEVIQSEVIRSLLLAGSPIHTPALSIPNSSEVNLQGETLEASKLVCPLSDPSTVLLDQKGVLDVQVAESASAQSEPMLLHQALMMAAEAHWIPQDFGACEPDSSESDSAGSESGGSHSGSNAAAQADLTTTGLDRVLVMAMLATFHCCLQSPVWIPVDSSPTELTTVSSRPQ